MIAALTEQFRNIVDLGGPVVVLLLILSVISLAVALYKAVQFVMAGVGIHKRAMNAVADWASGHESKGLALVSDRKSLSDRIAHDAMRALHAQRLQKPEDNQLESYLSVEADQSLSKLERGFRILDSVAQIAPLLGLFGTVLGMIEAFQKLQNAGNAVDPSILAGGIWVALLTTAVGLAVAMPTSLFLTYFESRVARERQAAELIISRLLGPQPVGAPIQSTNRQLEPTEALAAR
ncbi:MAG: MotA/TolQ/ExbB proton channel family protein [Pseudomonadota bacterium]